MNFFSQLTRLFMESSASEQARDRHQVLELAFGEHHANFYLRGQIEKNSNVIFDFNDFFEFFINLRLHIKKACGPN